MNIICILQNAWGDRKLPMIFRPNPYNKSAKVIRKMVGTEHVFDFCNTTDVVTETAKGNPSINENHFSDVILSISLKQLTDNPYDLILVCGRQAERAVNLNMDRLNNINIPIIIVPHPASRSLSNIQIDQINKNINALSFQGYKKK